ncbi:MAG TPA: hypothetical protein PLW81_02750 [Thiobacillaceae bacterium]|nr:hypothetical protein [Thiobacillaceae bacterium]
MKFMPSLLSAFALSIATIPAQSADIEAGKAKAGSCVICHGDQGFGGIFYTLQLAGRNADKLTVKTNKYKTGKVLHPIMNLATMSLTDQDIENISAYYQSMGKPAFVLPFVQIKGDDEATSHTAPAPAPVAGWSNVAAYK